ncbi:MFS transporter [Acinetobacter rudis]|uniref:Major facilitator superfamily (MFS) profile domain-containing protein n=1 Tax=Acinetobacter rudis CIP 110305 TaxID=421052 RepID=S3MU03_9GAMM|nr:MFS transporter [Acinetobacter rudis]EPF70063.1 hypothetical protein F945_03080 [Acinetobacter rudis CIP 110305]
MSPQLDISQNKSLLWLMAVACGLCAGANYYCQPLIHSIQQYFSVTAAQASLTVTFAQVSYALGLLLIVPVGDIVNKTKFIPLLMFFAAVGLFICAFSTNLNMLWIGTIIVGMFSVAAQVLIPLAAIATRPDRTGQVVGFLMSGLLVGLLISTSMAGLLSNLFNWQLIYLLSGICMLILAALLMLKLPAVKTVKMSYLQIFHSMGQLIATERRLVYRSLLGGCAFAAMSILFSTIAVLLTSKPFELSDVMVGVVTLVGVFGALSTTFLGRIADRGHTKLLTWSGIVVLAISWIFLYFGGQYLVSYIIGFGVINLGLVLVHTSNQNIIFRLRPDAKGRVNSVYMTNYFIGGACGSALGVYGWHHGGWSMACMIGLMLVAAAAFFAALDLLHVRRQTESEQQISSN